MDISVSNISNPSFGKRYLRVKKGSEVPERIMTALKQNEAVDSFLKESNPGNFKGKLLDFLKRNEYLEVELNRGVFAEYDILRFFFRKSFSKECRTGALEIDRKAVASHPDYKSGCRWSHKGINFDIADETLIKQIRNIKSIDEILTATTKL